MKTVKLLICTAFILLAISMEAQPRKEKIETYKIAFITQKLNLTSQEAQQFWPIYNEYADKLEVNRKNYRQTAKKANVETMTDKEAEEFLSAEYNMKQKELDLYKEYYDKFKKVLPIKKVALLRQTEEEFKRELIKNIRERKKE